MAKIKIEKCRDNQGRIYYGASLEDVFPANVVIVGGGDTPEEAIAEMKENARVYLDYILEEAECVDVEGKDYDLAAIDFAVDI